MFEISLVDMGLLWDVKIGMSQAVEVWQMLPEADTRRTIRRKVFRGGSSDWLKLKENDRNLI